MEPAPGATTARIAWTGTGGAFEVETKRARMRLESGADRTALSPMEAMLAAVAGCMAVDVVDILAKMRRPPTSYSVDCEGWRAGFPPRRFTRIRLTHRAAGSDLDQESVRRAVALSQEKYCSAMASLDPGIEIDNRIILKSEEAAV